MKKTPKKTFAYFTFTEVDFSNSLSHACNHSRQKPFGYER